MTTRIAIDCMNLRLSYPFCFTPTDYVGVERLSAVRIVPRSIPPLAGKRQYVRSGAVLSQHLKQFVRRWRALVKFFQAMFTSSHL